MSGARKDFLKYIFTEFREFHSIRGMGRYSIGCHTLSWCGQNWPKNRPDPWFLGHSWPILTTSAVFVHPIEHLTIPLVLSNLGKIYFRKSFKPKQFWWFFDRNFFRFLLFWIFSEKIFVWVFLNFTYDLHKE